MDAGRTLLRRVADAALLLSPLVLFVFLIGYAMGWW
jgi:hypothetical protein